MKASEVYLRAAKMIDANLIRHSCDAIGMVIHGLPGRGSTRKVRYANLFKPNRNFHDDQAWGEVWGQEWSERKACRILALLLMSEIAKDSE